MGSARLESLNGRGRKRRRGKGRSLALENSRPRPPWSNPSPPPLQTPLPPPRELSRERLAPTPALRLRPPDPRVLDTLAAPDHAPRVGCSHQGNRGLSTGLVSRGRELRAASQRSGKKWASNTECQGPAVRDGIATRILPSVSAGQSLTEGYGVSLLVHKNRRQFHLVGMVRMCFCQREERI